jgi:hypothetical protein
VYIQANPRESLFGASSEKSIEQLSRLRAINKYY